MSDKIEFKIGDEEFAVRKPTIAEHEAAQKEYIKAYRAALDSGAIMKIKMDDYMRSQGIWTAEDEVKLREITSQIATLEKELHDGGFPLRELYRLENGVPKGKAIELKKLRKERQNLQSKIATQTDMTAEGQAQNRQFNELLASCLVYNKTGQRYWKNYEDLLKRMDEPVAIEAFKNFTLLLYGVDPNFEGKLPENKRLKVFGFCDEKFRLIRDGKLIDEDGKLINEKGQWVNESGQIVDINGVPLDENGEYVGEEKPFLDDNGNPIILVGDSPANKLEVEEKKDQTG